MTNLDADLNIDLNSSMVSSPLLSRSYISNMSLALSSGDPVTVTKNVKIWQTLLSQIMFLNIALNNWVENIKLQYAVLYSIYFKKSQKINKPPNALHNMFVTVSRNIIFRQPG